MGNAVAGAARKAVLSAEFVFDLFRLGALAVTKPIDPLLSGEHIAAVGALVVAMSRIDGLLTDLLAGFMECDIMRALIAFHHQQPSSKIDTLRALRERVFLGVEEFVALHEPLNEAKRLFSERNTIVHCSWMIDDDGTPRAVRFSARGKFKRTRNPYPVSKIFELVRKANELQKTLARMRAHFPARELRVDQQ